MKTTEHNEKWDLIAKHLANECSEKENIELNNWINENIENEIEFSEIKNDWEILNLNNTMKEINVDNAWDKLKNRIEEDKNIITMNDKRTEFRLPVYMKYAAFFIMLLGIGYLTSKVYKNVASGKMLEYVASNNSVNEIVLNDGTKVYLNNNSKLSYPAQFSSDIRKVKLTGEAFFDVAKNPDKPFIIEVQNTEIKVLGTSFNVNSNLPDHQVEVFVETGIVQVTQKNGEEKSVVIYPGDIVTVTKNQINQTKNSNENIIAWKTKTIVFKEENLKNVIHVLNKVYNTNISCNDQSILDLRFTSTFKNQDIESILSVICLAFDLKIDEHDNQITIVSNIN